MLADRDIIGPLISALPREGGFVLLYQVMTSLGTLLCLSPGALLAASFEATRVAPQPELPKHFQRQPLSLGALMAVAAIFNALQQLGF